MADSAAPTAPTAPAAPAQAAAPAAPAPTASAPEPAAPASAATPAAPSVTAGGAGAAGTPGTATFDALAGTRPRIRRDVLFTETPGGVLFHNADGGFHLTGRTAYRFASLVVPHLTGAHRLADLCAGFGPAQRAMAAELVKTLYARGFARDIPGAESAGETVDEETAERFAAQIAYVDHYTDDAPARFARYRATRVAVLGDDETAHWCALSLVRNGCAAIGTAAPATRPALATAPDGLVAEAAANGARVEAIAAGAGAGWADLGGYDVVVVTGADAGARTHRLLAAGVPEGVTLIPAWLFGRRLVVGPLATADSAGCWNCALLRLGGNVDATTAAELWSEAAGAAPTARAPLSGPVAAMVGNLVGYEIFRLATGALPAETAGHVLVQDLESLDVMAEPVQPHPRCTRCAALPAAGGAASPAALPEGLALPITATVETARDAEELVEELNRISAVLVRPYTGIFRSYDDEELTQTPLKLSRVEVALGDGGRRRVAAFDVHHLAGARTRALYAAAEAYVEHVVPQANVEDGDRADDRNLRTLGPEALTTGGGTGAVPAAWAVATSLIGKDPVRVPAAALRPFGPHNHDRAHLATAAGSGAGGSAAEAAGRGLLSALAHDALLRAVRGTTRVGPVAVGGDDPELVFLLKSAANLDIAVDLLDLGEADRTSASVVLAREADGPSSEGRWAVGAGLSRRAATAAALRDLLGQVQLAAEDPGAAVDPGDPLMADLAAGAIAVGGESVAADGAETTFDAVLEALRSAGRDALYVSTTPADLASVPVATARVLLTVDGEGGTDAR
ncbi:TOMM precursor leader peptide-binding protein [Streptomyces californicus]|uniref:TOMM leader peptide-binding protein n=1 Tax=Streptomyces californicus TaxID=67351 RepID=A0ABD7CY50_9ACTN|nr:MULTISPECIES: TOMM precursor leader peptide-binding protein [Streptomyces]QRV28134.1 TOMM precursor leader peptide-binding protein [Streptomyces californicus]QRV36200.1 TOMM precursor leader peptide-binding protein [Streptomyces californicus]QRV41534.1 TOMM precursor leader peptide-binding protein [Streptomyces californicus]QRV48291.1 TOMM precursor leader peptide-binding protein [Streptomyces californicus]